jgi:hypothetical protein
MRGGRPIRAQISLRAAAIPVSAYLRAAALLICAGGVLFASAGSFAIAAFWAYLAILAVVFVAAFALLDRGLLQERMRPGGKPTPLGLRLLNLVLLAHWMLAGLDRGRLHWSDSVPPWLQALGLIIIVAGYAFLFFGDVGEPLLFFRGAQPIRSRTRRSQQRPISVHPVSRLQRRHFDPGRASGVALGSWLAAGFLIAITIPFLLYRVRNEDRVLQSQLDGYADYARRVRWRLLPGVW